MSSSSDFERQLRDASLRVTRPRLAVLAAVHEHSHVDTDTVIGAVRATLGEVSHQAVYDVLRALTAAGLLRRIQPAGSVARYESRVGDNHHHLVCRDCGAITDVDCAVGHAPCLTPGSDAVNSTDSTDSTDGAADPAAGFEIDEAEVVWWGRCPACAEAARTT